MRVERMSERTENYQGSSYFNLITFSNRSYEGCYIHVAFMG